MQTTRYKDRDAILLENETLSAVIIPNPGGKLASLVNKKSGREYFVQRPDPHYKTRPYSGVFVEAECSGFDDMFPTIDEAHSEDAAWRGTLMPDHGEVWSLPWTAEDCGDGVRLTTHGVRFPYKLEKKVSLLPDGLRYDYALTNNAPIDFDYLWAGHLMINLDEKTCVSLPDDCRKAVTVLSNGSRAFGDVQTWPDFLDRENRPYRADVIRPKESGAFEKFYFMEKLKQGSCRLDYPNGDNLTVRFTTETVPYLGLLVNEDGWDGLYNIIIEPCSVGFDRPDTAKRFGQRSTLPASGRLEWTLEINVG